MLKYKIAVGHPGMGFGGSEARVMNLLELLQKNYDVTLVTTNNIDLSVWNSLSRIVAMSFCEPRS